MKEADIDIDYAYFENLVIYHPDIKVRDAAQRCLDEYRTSKWKSRYRRILVNDLAWALKNHINKDESA